MTKNLTCRAIFFIIFITGLANVLSAQSYDDYHFGAPEGRQSSIQFSFVELNFFSDLDTVGSKARIALHSDSDFGFGWEGLLIFADVSGETCTYWLSNFFIDVLFLEIWRDGYLGGSIGYAFGEELEGTKSISKMTASCFLSGPIIRAPDNFPVFSFDINFLTHKLSRTWDNFHIVAELIFHPFSGILRPFGITLGGIYGEMLDKSFWGISIGVCYGTYTIQ